MRYTIPFGFLFALPLSALAVDPPKVEEFAPHATGVALVEVVSAEKYDARPADGNAGVRFKFKLIRGTGDFHPEVHAITEYGGLRPPGFVPKPSLPVKADSLKKGERYWIAFASGHEQEKYNQGVIGFWPEKDAKAEALEAAVKSDAYRWHPQYDPKTELTSGRLIEKDGWRVRVEKGAKVLWTREIPGAPVEEYFSWGLWDNTGTDIPAKLPACGKVLIAETKMRLEKDNEFGLDPAVYYVNTGFDPESGKRVAAWVRKPQASHVALVNREYDPDTDKPKREERFAFLTTGGKAVGAKTEEWYRKIERTFDAMGKVTKEVVFRYDDTAEPDKRWVKVSK
jgi:hypothetical protein